MSVWGIGAFRVGEIYYYLGGSDDCVLKHSKEGDLFRVGVYPGSSSRDPLPHTCFWGKALMGEMRFLRIPMGLPRAPFRPATEEEIKAAQMKLDIANLKPLDRVLFKGEYAGQWATVHEGPSGLNAFRFDGESYDRYIAVSTLADLIDRVVPAQSGKDPFAVGAWVVCGVDDSPAIAGDMLQVISASDKCSTFNAKVDESNFVEIETFYKSRFRPATPEEISAHLEKNDMAGKPVIPCDADPKPLTSEDCELKITSAVPLDTDAQGDGKITFTVAGREFFVGQRVWAEEGGFAFSKADELEVIGPINNAPLALCVRKPSSSIIYFIGHAAIATTKPKPHEWQFGDQASHPEHGAVLVIDVADLEGFHCASPSDPEIFIDPSELTFIRRTDLGE